ncbi:hypothetical protein ACFL08_01425 [Patescibacteria group bacterium]
MKELLSNPNFYAVIIILGVSIAWFMGKSWIPEFIEGYRQEKREVDKFRKIKERNRLIFSENERVIKFSTKSKYGSEVFDDMTKNPGDIVSLPEKGKMLMVNRTLYSVAFVPLEDKEKYGF